MYQRGAFTGKLISLEIFYSKYLSFLFKGSEQYSLRNVTRGGQERPILHDWDFLF